MKPRVIMQGDCAAARRFIIKTRNVFDWLCVFDRDKAKDGGVFEGIPIHADIERIRDMAFEWLYVSAADILGVQQEYAGRYGVAYEKILSVRYCHQSPKFDLFSGIADEIYRKNVPGAAAELGVNWGDSAKQINLLFHDRQLYCFDTFSGFAANDETGKHNAMFDSAATPELVKSKMPYPELCAVKAGYFPESLDGLEQTFAFVHIDCDLYKPIMAGLTYFYPRLNAGGYLCVHDYFNERFPEARKAVNSFCDERNVIFTPVYEYGGVVIVKGNNI